MSTKSLHKRTTKECFYSVLILVKSFYNVSHLKNVTTVAVAALGRADRGVATLPHLLLLPPLTIHKGRVSEVSCPRAQWQYEQDRAIFGEPFSPKVFLLH